MRTVYKHMCTHVPGSISYFFVCIYIHTRICNSFVYLCVHIFIYLFIHLHPYILVYKIHITAMLIYIYIYMFWCILSGISKHFTWVFSDIQENQSWHVMPRCLRNSHRMTRWATVDLQSSVCLKTRSKDIPDVQDRLYKYLVSAVHLYVNVQISILDIFGLYECPFVLVVADFVLLIRAHGDTMEVLNRLVKGWKWRLCTREFKGY